MIPEDRLLSPYTGWTRTHWEGLADAQLAAVRPYATDRHALIHLPGPASRSGRHSDGLEGFARTFLLAGFRLARSGDNDAGGHASWYAEGLAAGTDPNSPEHWPSMRECGQAKVECASVAIALHETRRWIWDRLDEGVRQRVVAWMTDLLDSDVSDNNWVWFRAITSAFLRSVGAPWSASDIDHAIARTEDWYAGDGWYSDGNGAGGPLRHFDHYSGWAMQYYPLWYCRISGADADPDLLPRYRARLRSYLDDAQYLVAADGAPLYQGRSLTYRYATLCPLWVGAVFDATPLPAGRTRRLASGVLRHFTEAGCFDGRGLQSLGWHGEFTAIRQPYSGPGSPYWSSKGFAGLVLPAEHPVWAEKEESLPIETRDVRRTLTAPGWLVSGTAADGIVRIVNHGSDHAFGDGVGPEADDPVYSRLAYASHAAPDSTEASLNDPLDSHIALLDAEGHPSHRRPLTRLHLGVRTAVSRHRAHWPLGPVPAPYAHDPAPSFRTGPWITTASVLNGPLEVRLARVDGPVQEPLRLRLGGYCLAAAEPPFTHEGTGPGAWVRRPDGLFSTVVALRGFDEAGVATAQDANALGPYSATPWLATTAEVQPGTVYAALVCLSGVVEGPAAAEGVHLEVSYDDGTALASVTWPDGTKDTVRLESPR
ncbi:DUF2264 domain-containing protein [Streptomyces phaeochromogenes]|uniref:DUF2264 domain-containing protein n=1 Tax=Streptomyces phaeochromogenes TaxID=1923 RepID=A0ABZ1HNG4_STRPH|nr:DUF2264 domain-containing protein [Streptomyces phaeochromogenes]WSD20142.1 DUF2264 domain-containing protein [Streptomyces phaeochromogenes]